MGQKKNYIFQGNMSSRGRGEGRGGEKRKKGWERRRGGEGRRGEEKNIFRIFSFLSKKLGEIGAILYQTGCLKCLW